MAEKYLKLMGIAGFKAALSFPVKEAPYSEQMLTR